VRALDRFDRGRPFGPWLYRIAVNRAIDWSRSRALRAEAEERDVVAPNPPERDDELLPALASLDPDHRAVIVLRYLLEWTPGEIAEALDIPRGTVNSRLRRGLDKLKERLE
jgi:RNA polymerase sigma-70 factor (ECF subfamily)